MKKRHLYYMGGVVLLGLLIGSLWGADPIVVEVEPVRRGAMEVVLQEEGRTRVKEPYVISAPVRGQLMRVQYRPGDPINEEQVVATIRPADPELLDARSSEEAEAAVASARAALQQRQAQLNEARAALTFARQELQRTSELHDRGVVSDEQLDQARLNLESQQERVSAARHALDGARSELRRAKARFMSTTADRTANTLPLLSPLDGVVLERFRWSEGPVTAGQQILKVGDPGELEVVADYLSTDAVQIRPDQPVQITNWGTADVLEGVVGDVEPEGFTKVSALGVEEQRVNVVIDFENGSEPARQLGAGYRVEVGVVVWSADETIVAPSASLFQDETQWALYEVVDGHAILRHVDIGHHTSEDAEVLSGVEPGATVVVYPSDKLSDGAPIIERDQTTT